MAIQPHTLASFRDEIEKQAIFKSPADRRLESAIRSSGMTVPKKKGFLARKAHEIGSEFGRGAAQHAEDASAGAVRGLAKNKGQIQQVAKGVGGSTTEGALEAAGKKFPKVPSRMLGAAAGGLALGAAAGGAYHLYKKHRQKQRRKDMMKGYRQAHMQQAYRQARQRAQQRAREGVTQ